MSTGIALNHFGADYLRQVEMSGQITNAFVDSYSNAIMTATYIVEATRMTVLGNNALREFRDYQKRVNYKLPPMIDCTEYWVVDNKKSGELTENM